MKIFMHILLAAEGARFFVDYARPQRCQCGEGLYGRASWKVFFESDFRIDDGADTSGLRIQDDYRAAAIAEGNSCCALQTLIEIIRSDRATRSSE